VRFRAPERKVYITCMHPILMTPIGRVRNAVHGEKEDYWGDVQSTIELDDKTFTPDALAGLEEFSYVEIFFHFHQVADSAVVAGPRYPRGSREWPLTALPSAAKPDPTEWGASICRLLAVNQLQLTVVVPGCVSWNTCP